MNKAKKSALRQIYSQFMETGFKSEGLSSLQKIVVKEVAGFGSANDQKIKGIAGLKALLHNQKKQTTGMELTWKTKPFSHYITDDENTAVFAEDVYLTIKARKNLIKMYLRFSVVLNFVNNQWKVIHWHGSKPEQVQSEEDTYGIDSLKQKNAELEKLVEEKTADLSEKNRELQIEAALERVRAATMTMKDSSELGQLIFNLYNELTKLDAKLGRCFIMIVNPDTLGITWWLAGKEGLLADNGFLVPNNNYPSHQLYLKHWKKKTMKWQYLLQGKEKKDFDRFGFSKTALANLPEPVKKDMAAVKKTFLFGSSDRFGCLLTGSLEPLSAEHQHIISRFAKVFNQTYTRFLDLQKAEAQAREAQIEASLERVRSRTMAMHQTSELQEVIHTVHNELLHLNISIDGGSFVVINKDVSSALRCWGSGGTANTSSEILIPDFKMPFCTNLMNGIKKGPGFFTEEFSQKEKKQYFSKLFKHKPWSDISSKQKNETLSSPGGYTRSVAVSKHTSIFIINHQGRKFTEDENDILKRFAKIFEQTYTRFLDLQKAEAQAREAQIEAAVERVRSKALGMHHSDEIHDVVHTMRNELFELKLRGVGGVTICLKQDDGDVRFWDITDVEQDGRYVWDVLFDIKKIDPLLWIRKIWSSKEKIISCEQDTNDLNRALNWLGRYNKQTAVQIKGMLKQNKIRHSWHRAVRLANGRLITDFMNEPPVEIDSILLKIGAAFDLAYQRFLDLQKAEAQAREAQIEASLEKVRAVALSMQKSGEMLDVAKALYEQLLNLGFHNIRNAIIDVHNDKNETFLDYDYSHEMGGTVTLMSYFDGPFIENQVRQIQSGNDVFFELILEGKELQNLIDIRIKNGEKEDPRLLKTKQLTYNLYSFGNGCIGISNFALLSDENKLVLKRFRNVFAFSYKRYADMAQAEAQAREAKIEVALERVRSRSMAMHKSDELKEVIRVVFEQFVYLNLNVGHAGFYIDYKAHDDMHIWLADPNIDPFYAIIPYFDSPTWNSFREAKAKGTTLFTNLLDFKTKNKFYKSLFKLFRIPEEAKTFYMKCKGLAVSTVLLNNVGLYIENFDGIPYTEEENNLLMRFGKVFQQTYTRFLDLQKTEAQAREAQIQLALERVRARTMAMQKSDELGEVALLLFEQVKKLGIETYASGFNILNQEKKNLVSWMSNPTGAINPPFEMPVESFEQHRKIYESWKNNEDFLEDDLTGEALAAHYKFLRSHPLLDEAFKKSEAAGIETPNRQVHNISLFSQGFLLFITFEPHPEFRDIFIRFAKVFEQTYTRFLDLQKAESQAREAQIEAALERVRARAMSMHTSNELKEVATEMRNQLHLLGQKALETCAIHLYDTTTDYVETWAALRLPDSDDEMVRVEATYPKKGIRLLEEAFANYSSGKNDYLLEADRDKEIEFFEEIKKRSPDAYNLVIESTKHKKENEIWAYWSVSDFQGGSLVMVTGDEPYEEEKKLMRRFANVFGLAYQRFVDLQKTETSAREAIKQAAIDRIRADIASMRTTEDLERITPVIWTELKILGIPFIRCGVFIIDEEKALIHTFLSTPEGKAITAIHIPYNTPGKIQLIPKNWRANKPYTDHWQDTDFVDFANVLTQQKVIASPDEYLSAVPHGGFYLHFVPFVQGMMYVGNTTKLSEEEINLIQSVADAFSTAYARYEDFNKLESAKKQVDSTLVELQATQKQLIQSEKMASLGELTAGIAHEIQNPLNFVNNFSEVSKELLDEMKEAMDKGNLEEAKDIMKDVIENLEKINHHGQRADAIVKGMLQHSRTSTGQKEMTEINALCDEYLRLSYHGLRAKDKSFNAKFETNFDTSLPKINVVPQEIGRVILNLINNAFYAVNERKKLNEPGFEPTVWIKTNLPPTLEGRGAEISVKDNGIGIPQNIVDKIFQPFFTTKPTGSGTGLGLSLAYDIITKGHGGELKVETKEGEGTKFMILLPEL